ncbi:MAG: heme exporter protein CcmD [Burkholderiales bacterium]|nr:heme exporter protein CcmD [Burkholderiales bacterium]
MADLHWTFIGAAYGLTAVAIVVELVALMQRRRRAIARVRSEREFDEDERGD